MSVGIPIPLLSCKDSTLPYRFYDSRHPTALRSLRLKPGGLREIRVIGRNFVAKLALPASRETNILECKKVGSVSLVFFSFQLYR